MRILSLYRNSECQDFCIKENEENKENFYCIVLIFSENSKFFFIKFIYQL